MTSRKQTLLNLEAQNGILMDEILTKELELQKIMDILRSLRGRCRNTEFAIERIRDGADIE